MSTPAEKLKAYVAALDKDMDARIQGALVGIPSIQRHLLAVRGYLRYPSMGRGSITDNWAWSQKDMEEFKKSADFTRMESAVKDVKSTFASQNPGHTLSVDPGKVRTLEQQVSLWNQNASVQTLGQELEKAMLKTVASLPDTPDAAGLETFKTAVRTAGLTGSPTNATPGLSQHGQARAFDFVVMKGRDVIAGTVTKTSKEKWDDAGWTAKLRTAVESAGNQFVGPLAAPYEPWHYVYKTAAATTETRSQVGNTFSTDMCGTSLGGHH